MIDAPFPTLRVVPLDQCLLHEDIDGARVARLAARLSADGVLRNPPILGRHAAIDALIVLDGATRVTALRSIEIPHLVAQVVDYDDDTIQLHAWSHVLSDTTLDALCGILKDAPLLEARACTHREAEQALARREALAYLADTYGHCVTLGHGVDMAARAAALHQLFAAYADRAIVARAAPAEWPARLKQTGASVAVIYPTYTKREIVEIAQAGAVLPAGITRHVIPGRALRVNAPIDRRPLAEKQAWLDAWLSNHSAGHGVRYYAEPTFLFDE
jgi:hypothetical protein